MGSPGALARSQPQGPGPHSSQSVSSSDTSVALIPRMASGRTRCTRKLRNWVVEQVESGQFPGVCWEDAAKTMFRIPWKHAGKQDFREDQDAAFFKVKGLETGLSEGGMEHTLALSPCRVTNKGEIGG